MSEPTGALAGVKVVTCSTAQAGTVPYMLMADLGAEVIKIEAPGRGDPSRQAGERFGDNKEISSFFETNNRGVKSLTLNLKSDDGRAILHKLIASADVFGQNFRPGAAERNGFGYEQLKQINPKLVYASVSGYGQSGPDAHLPGTDAVGQALAGVAEVYAIPGQPMRTGSASVADESCAMLTFGGLLAALLYAQRTGIGQKVETSLVGSAFRLMGWTMTTAMWREKDPIAGARINGTRERPGLAACFNDSNGKPVVFQLDGEEWPDAMSALGFVEGLKAKGAYDLGLALVDEDKKNIILQTLGELFATGPRERWIEILRNADIVSAPVNTLLEASIDPNIVENGYVTEVAYPEIDRNLKVHGTPWRFSETPARIGRAPALSEHTKAILTDLGYSDAEITDFAARKIV